MPKEILHERFETRAVSTANFFREDGRERGKENEGRALALLRELADEGTFIRVRRASKRQNLRRGIDMFGTVALTSNAFTTDEIQIPFQVKSSLRQGRIFLGDHLQTLSRRKIIVVVVNESRSDKVIKESIQENVWLLLRYGDRFLQSKI